MNKEIFKSDRYFRVFDFLVSHGQLLLRSSKNDDNYFNVDIIFFDTTFMQLFTMLYGINVRIIDQNETIQYNSVKKYLKYDHKNFFELESRGEKYYLAASYVRVFENDLEFSETSLGFENKGRSNEIATSLITQ